MRYSGVVAGVVAAVMLSGAVMGDWPQWRGAGRDAKVTDFKAPATWPKELTAKWTTKVGVGTDSSVALVGDKLFVLARQGDDEVISCLDAGTGKELWNDKYATAAIGGPDARAHPGPRSSPAVADGKVVAFGVNGVLSCLNAADGKVLWRKDTAKEQGGLPRFHTASSPLIVDGMVIVQLGGATGGEVAALDLATGNEKWKSPSDSPAYASPALVTVGDAKLIVTLTDKSIIAVNLADGKEVWKADFAPAGMSYNAVSPVVDGAVVYYSGSARGTKAVKFEKDGDGFKAPELWSNTEASAAFCTPVLHDGLLFGLSAGGGGGRRGGGGGMRGGGGMGGGGGKFYCIDAKTGKSVWTDATARGTEYGEMVDAGSAIIALTSAGQLTVLDPAAKEYKELASIKLTDKPTYGYPIVSGNRIFVRDDENVAMYVVE